MTHVRRSIPCSRRLVAALALTLVAVVGARGDDNAPTYAIVDDELVVRGTRIIEIREDVIVHIDDTGEVTPLEMNKCVALVKTAGREERRPPAIGHVLYLADGQRLPGAMAVEPADEEDHIAWTHPWLGRFEISLENVRAVTFHRGIAMPTADGADAITLANGDRIEGFVIDIANEILIQLEGAEEGEFISIPLPRVASVALHAGARASTGRRIWFEDGTTLDAAYLVAGPDSYLRLRPAWASPLQAPIDVRLADVSAIVFDPQRLVPLSTLSPSAVEMNAPRFHVPAPTALDENATLGAHTIEYQGPLVIRYGLPDGVSRFAARAVVPLASRHWASFELVIRVDDAEIYRERFDAGDPEREINLELRGAELMLEMLIGDRGPVHDRLLLENALLLVDR